MQDPALYRTPLISFSSDRKSNWGNRIWYLWYQSRARARTKGMPFEIDKNWAMERLVEQKYRCAKTGISLQLSCPRNGTTRSAFSPSLDRIDSSKGYTKDNTQLVCLMYNAAKNQFDEQDVVRFAEALVMESTIVIDNK